MATEYVWVVWSDDGWHEEPPTGVFSSQDAAERSFGDTVTWIRNGANSHSEAGSNQPRHFVERFRVQA